MATNPLAMIEVAEHELLDIAGALDEPVQRDEFKLTVLVLGQRSRTLYRGFLELQAGSVPSSSRAFLRPLIESNILIRFLAKNPKLHVELWQAEGERNSLAIIEEHNRLHAERWGRIPDDPSDEERRETVRTARKLAIEAGLPRAEKRTALLPSTSEQLKLIDERAANEAYTLGYRPMSWEVHSGAPSFLNGLFEPRKDGSVSYTEESTAADLVGVRALGMTTFASTLELVGMHVGFPIADDARRIRSEYVPDEIPEDQRFDREGE
jgi:Family of unknown function (DUF5677)